MVRMLWCRAGADPMTGGAMPSGTPAGVGERWRALAHRRERRPCAVDTTASSATRQTPRDERAVVTAVFDTQGRGRMSARYGELRPSGPRRVRRLGRWARRGRAAAGAAIEGGDEPGPHPRAVGRGHPVGREHAVDHVGDDLGERADPAAGPTPPHPPG